MTAPVFATCEVCPSRSASLARKAAGPVERRARRENHEAGMRDQHAAPRPVVFIGKAPLGAAEDSLPNAPAARGKESGEPASHGVGIARGLEARVERNGVDLDRAQAGSRAGMTRLNVQTASDVRINPMMPTYHGE
jgi:hypothetical protein